MATLHIFIIHSEGLTQRAVRLHGIVQNMRLVAQQLGYEVRPYFVLTPSPSDISSKQEEYQSKLNYDPTGLKELDVTTKVLSVEILSNLEKHVKAWQMIDDTNEGHKDDIFMVLEDDVFLLPGNVPNYVELLRLVQKQHFDNDVPWDLLLLGISRQDGTNTLTLQNTTEHFKLIPSKEAYLITRAAVATMLKDFTATIKFGMRGQLSWYALTHPSLRLRNPSKQVTLDGSKLGITPTTLHENTTLVYNAEYMQMLTYMSMTKEELVAALPTLGKIYASVSALNSPHIAHLYGVLLYKAGEMKEVSDIMDNAITLMKQQQGLLNSRTELLNNYIDMCKDLQIDLPSIFREKSKYSGIV